MAIMIPDETADFSTAGEGTFYRFLQAVAKPDHHYIAWYLPDIQGHEPDFIIYSSQFGLVIFEVKDWDLEQVVSADPQHFILQISGSTQKRRNPLQQARDYIYRIMDKIKKDGRLVSKQGHSHGNVKIPVSYGVVFPYINKHEYRQKSLDKVIPADKVFFWDDLHPQSPICSDPSGRCFQDNMNQMFSPLFDFSITQNELTHLKQLLFPVVRIDLPSRAEHWNKAEDARHLKILDKHQESIARQYGPGHRLITGPSGSGKTLILVHRAALLRQYIPNVRRVLFVCYNVTLVNFIKRLLSDKQVPLGDDGVEVMHFFQLCARICGEDVKYENENQDYYERVIQAAQEKLPDYPVRYDAVFIDEGQDFSDDMLRVVMPLLNPWTNHFTMTLDAQQDIYERPRSWKAVGIQARGRVHRLSWAYRNTKQITDLAASLSCTQKSSDETASDEQLQLFPDTFGTFQGPPPEITAFSNFHEIPAYVADKIRQLADGQGYPLSEIAILYAMKAPDRLPGVHVPHLLGSAMESRGILHHWISEDFRAKQSYDITTEKVAISTIHSVKGFDYACVFVIGLDWLEPGRWTQDQIDRLACVAVTRARQHLFVPYCFENHLIRKMVGAV